MTRWQHLVARYVGISLLQVQDLDYYDYLVLRRDAFIYELSQTEAGLEYLDNAYRSEQTKPDRIKLRKYFRKEAGQNG